MLLINQIFAAIVGWHSNYIPKYGVYIPAVVVVLYLLSELLYLNQITWSLEMNYLETGYIVYFPEEDPHQAAGYAAKAGSKTLPQRAREKVGFSRSEAGLQKSPVQGDDLSRQIGGGLSQLQGQEGDFFRGSQPVSRDFVDQRLHFPSEKQRFMSVSMTPQAMALTWILLGASSFASAFVRLLTAPLEAE